LGSTPRGLINHGLAKSGVDIIVGYSWNINGIFMEYQLDIDGISIISPSKMV
jgi:hypothetical protein